MALPTPMLLLLSALLVGLLCSPAVAEEEATAKNNDVLFSEHGARLNSGESLRNGRFRLTMRRDCNLVLEEMRRPFPPRTGIRWMSNTSSAEQRADRCYLEVSPHGSINIIEQHQSGVRVNIFSCGNSATVGMYALVLRADGRFGTYGPRIWSIDAVLPSDAKRRGILHSGYEKTGKGTILRDGKNELLIDDNNRLVTQIYDRDGKVTFRYDVSPEYTFQGQPHFVFRTSGELVYSDLRVRENDIEIKHQVWSSGVTSNAVDHICALPDLGVYGLRELIYDGAKAICGVVLPQPRNEGLLTDE